MSKVDSHTKQNGDSTPGTETRPPLVGSESAIITRPDGPMYLNLF